VISEKIKNKILDGLLKNAGCRESDLLNVISQFFDIYEEIYKRILEDPDYKFVITHYPGLINSDKLEPLTLTGWKLGNKFEHFFSNTPLVDPKNRNFVDIFGIFEYWPSNDSFEKLKRIATKKEMTKLNKLARDIKRIIDKRNQVRKLVNSILEDRSLLLEDLEKYAPTLYKAYEER
jgi:hypothetical protein